MTEFLIKANGDSITEQTGARDETFREALGWLTWLAFLTGQKYRMPNALNFGVGGDDSNEMVARLNDMKGVESRYTFIQIGTNDFNAGIPLETTFANYQTTIDFLKSNNDDYYFLSVPPKTDDTDEETIKRFKMNEWLSENLADRFIDIESVIVDPDSSVGDYGDGMSLDGTHLTPKSAYFIALKVAEHLGLTDEFIPVDDMPLFDQRDLFHATLNPTGNLVVNGGLDGNSGSNAEPIGIAPDGWTTDVTSGTATVSFAKRLDGLLEGSITGSTTDDPIIQVTQTVDLAKLEAGKKLTLSYFGGALEDGNGRISTIAGELRVTRTDGSYFYRDLDYYSALTPCHDKAYFGKGMTEQYTIDGTESLVMVRMQVLVSSGEADSPDKWVMGNVRLEMS